MDELLDIILLFLDELLARRRLKKEQEELVTKHKSHTTYCTNCNSPMNSLSVFCPRCWHLVPQVKEMLQNNPYKQPHEFLKLPYEGMYKCPHCGAKPISIKEFVIKTPIIRCPYCHNYFLDNSIPEPYINKKPNPWELLFSKLLTICFVTLVLAFFAKLPPWIWLAVTTAAIFLYALFFSKDSSEEFHKSKLRVERNPDYLQCLADMGYLHQMTPKFRSMIDGYFSITCKCCGSKNNPTESFCKDCSTPLPSNEYPRKYIYPSTDNSETETISESFLLKLLVVCLMLIACIIFVWL